MKTVMWPSECASRRHCWCAVQTPMQGHERWLLRAHSSLLWGSALSGGYVSWGVPPPCQVLHRRAHNRWQLTGRSKRSIALSQKEDKLWYNVCSSAALGIRLKLESGQDHSLSSFPKLILLPCLPFPVIKPWVNHIHSKPSLNLCF